MFGNNNKKEVSSTSSTSGSTLSGGGINSLGDGTKLNGDLSANSDIRIDGTLEGNLICKGKLILGPKGTITGTVDCQSAVIEGKINGTVKVKDVLQIKESAVITGDITTDKLIVQSGAVFNVKCEMGGQKVMPKSTPAAKTA